MRGTGNLPGVDPILTQASALAASATSLPLARPTGLAIDAAHRRRFVADTDNGLVRCVDDATGISKVIAGSLTSAIAPDGTARGATGVSLGRPAALAFDTQSDEVYVVDGERNQVLAVQRPGTADATVAVVVDPPAVSRPGAIAHHRFANGQRLLFVLDRGVDGRGPAPSMPPSLAVVDLDTQAVARIVPTLAPGFVFRGVLDVHVRPLDGGAAELYVLADVGEVEGDGLAPFFIETELNFEVDCHDGLDGDDDGLVDADDPDCHLPLQINVLRFDLPVNGIAVTSGASLQLQATRHLRCVRRFPVREFTPAIDCPPVTVPLSPIGPFDETVVGALTVDRDGRVFLLDAIHSTVHFADLDGADNVLRSGIVAGIDAAAATPFDGNDPRLTRWDHPRSIRIDDLDNLFVVDTANNRVRRMWVGDIVGP